MEFDELSKQVIGYAIEVHKHLGPGLLESCYETCLSYELRQAGIFCEAQKPLPVVYKGMALDCGYRIDVLVENQLILELKATETIQDIHMAQLLTYLKLSKIKTGLIINFNNTCLKGKNAIRRLVL